jgi:hypothetical protein
MRMPMVVLAAIAVLLVPGWAKAKDPTQSGVGGYVDTNRKKLTKDYFVVREGQSDQCKIVVGDFGDKPEGAIGGAPYASKTYAQAALKTFPQCKGTTEPEGKKHEKK